MLLGSTCRCSRRGVLTGFSATAVAATLGPGQAGASAPSPRRIDVHHHCFPKAWFDKKKAEIIDSSDNGPELMSHWTPQAALEQMDRNGIQTAILSVGNPGVWYGDIAEARGLVRGCNDYMAQVKRDYPKRFGVFAVLALPDVGGSLKEIEYAYDTLKVDGVHLMSSFGAVWPGDPKFAAIFDELNRRKAVVFVHPDAPSCCAKLQPGIATTAAEFPFDETRGIMSLLFNGTFTRCPDIRFIFTHAGGPLPVLAERLKQQLRHPAIAKVLPNGLEPVLDKLWFDVANSTVSRPAMAALTTFTSSDKMLFGSDFPYVRIEKTADGLDKLGYGPDLVAAINRGNAAKLFPQFA